MPFEHPELDAEATKLTGEPTLPPLAGDWTTTTGVVADARVAKPARKAERTILRTNILLLLHVLLKRNTPAAGLCECFLNSLKVTQDWVSTENHVSGWLQQQAQFDSTARWMEI
jgi:hypothetical protein